MNEEIKAMQEGNLPDMDLLSEIFNALLPSDPFRQILGITVYEEKRAQAYQLFQAYGESKVEELSKQHEYDLSLKDERIKLLNDQSLAVQEQLDEANRENAEWTAKYESERDVFVRREAELAAEKERITKERDESIQENVKAGLRIQELENQVAELQSKLAAAQQPKESKPSGKLSDIMGQIKSKNEVAADEWLARFNARQKPEDKLEVPEITPPAPTESPFRSDSADTQTNAADDRIHTPEVDQVGGTFPVVEAPTVPALVNPMDQGQHSGEAPAYVTKAELEERLEQLKQEILTEVIGEGKVA